uniref:Putative NDBP n=1 Tax=Superstitionia donensis TaxID=311983 RepID=A0A1V1WBS0_9SCOR
MQFKKALLVIFISYLLVTDEAEAFWGFLAKMAGKVLPSLLSSGKKDKRKREIEDFYDPYQRQLDLENLLNQLDLN